MTDVEEYLRDAAALAGLTPEDLLARVLHVEDGVFAEVVAAMDGPTKVLAARLDHEIRIRNPGLHYVMRSMFIGYRREGVTHSPLGERSQIFLSLIRNRSRLEVVLPADPQRVASMPNAQDLQGKGHHGVGNVRLLLSNDSEVDRFLRDFDDWLAPRS
ncbi:hypothetical protein G6027_15215 [Dietzia sp. SLG310A2-38A2]|uniref:hypothetical protein n=1 Tax=Dietzia sp. SLG310A2-38A2 TaxID=1630643 RepID=UPI0015FAD2C3|nr:hypothetical protein [Dietzia sp. SLG310A2-38A2]MBB1032205.1 hypothetical protein [Dietzia sp. SLG310A2-38A2]